MHVAVAFSVGSEKLGTIVISSSLALKYIWQEGQGRTAALKPTAAQGPLANVPVGGRRRQPPAARTSSGVMPCCCLQYAMAAGCGCGPPGARLTLAVRRSCSKRWQPAAGACSSAAVRDRG